LAALLVAVSTAGCSNSTNNVIAEQSLPGRKIAGVEGDLLGSEFMGLKVSKEDISAALARGKQSYVEATTLYSLRTGELLQATVQVSRFTPKSEFKTERFRQSLLNQIGGSTPRAVQIGKHTVYLTTGTKQQLAVWFRDRYMFVLATRDDFDKPRSLLRQALEVKP
jgi:hypothetical protein